MPLKILTGLFALAMTPLMAAAGETTVGPYTIRYSALSSSFLPQVTTDKLGIGRSLHQGVINITVLKGQGAHASSVPARVTGTASTLTGSRIAITFKQINDDGGQSWIGTFTVPGNDTLRFDLEVTPQGASATRVQFTHDYIVD
ncbi:MAG: DUF4426 domain-containing protein [Rhodanobacteraceae bacterium]